MASVKVAVRARPFNQREIDMKSSEIIHMEGNKTSIENLKFQSLISCPNIVVSPQAGAEELGRERIKEFTFDYSYWSVNSRDPHFVTQEQVFNDLGQEVVDNAFEGYNACIFAYGQTGSGKTFTMMGSADNEGLIPRICQAMYTRMKLGQNSGTTFRTEVSYLEIYNEKVKDLLKRESTQHNLRVREHPKLGPYVQDLSRHLVMDYSDVEELMARGNSHRTTACTAMNDVSSRSHAIFTLNFTQAKFIRDLPSETVSKVNLVDLAGSERADSTKATGQRLKEGGHINKSLVTLGTVISALAELSTSHSKKRVFIPYRDSVLTWLLRDSLGGNSKTIMIATISPAECNYGETLSTLRYANRAKNIINKPTINEDPNVKLIKELREEIARLRSRAGGDDSSTQVMEKLQENEARVKFLTEEWTEKWKETHKILKEQKTLGLRMSGQGVVLDSERPHLIGLGDDILSTGVVLYHLKDGKTLIGTENATTKQDIVLSGLGIQDEHCSIELVDGGATLYPNPNSDCCINTMPVDKPTRLTQGCVVLLGSTNVFRYNDPAEVHKLRKEKERRSLVNLSHLSFLSRSAGDMSKSTESICGNGFESHEDGGERFMDLSMRKLLEKQSSNPEEQLNGAVIAPLSKEQEAVEAQLSQKREELRQLQEKTEELKRMADEAHRKAEEEQTKLEKVTEELRRHLEKQASEEQGSVQRIVQLQQELRYLTAKEKEVRENFEQLKNRLQQERVYVLSKLETEQSRLYDEIKSLEMKEQDLKEAIAKQHQELAKVEEEVKLKKDEYSSQTNLIQDEIRLLRSELDLSTTQASENWRSLLSLISGARDDLPLPKNTADLENIVESIRQQLADRKHAQLAEIHEERQSIAGQIEALAEKQKLLQSFADDGSPDEDGSGDGRSNRKGRGEEASGGAPSDENGSGDKVSSDDSDNEEVSTLVKGRLAFVGEEVRKLQEEEQALGRKEDDVEVGWRHNLDTLDSLLPLLESMVEDLDKLEGCISEKEQDVADIESFVNQCDTKVKGIVTEKENLEQQLLKVQDRKADADVEQKELKTSLNSLDDKMAFLAQQEEDILDTLKEQRQRVEEELAQYSNGNDHHILDALSNGSQLSSPTGGHNESFLLSRCDNLAPLTSSPMSNKLHHSSWDLHGLEEKYLIVERELEARRKAFQSECEETENDNVYLKQLRQMEIKHQEELLELIKEKAENMKRRNSGLNTPPCDGPSVLPGRRQNITSRSLPILPTHPYLSFEHGTEECPIRISIPSYTLRGSGSNAHIEYEVKVVVMDDSWTLYRRYKRFRELHDYMKLKYGRKVTLPYFPPKLLFGNKSQRLVEERRKMLEVYLIELVNTCRRDLSCPLHRSVQGLCKQHMWEFAPFFRKGCFETSKHSTG